MTNDTLLLFHEENTQLKYFYDLVYMWIFAVHLEHILHVSEVWPSQGGWLIHDSDFWHLSQNYIFKKHTCVPNPQPYPHAHKHTRHRSLNLATSAVTGVLCQLWDLFFVSSDISVECTLELGLFINFFAEPCSISSLIYQSFLRGD